MKYFILYLFLFCAGTSAYAQSKRTVNKQVPAKHIVIKKTELQIVEENSLKWFKEEIVEKSFVDPYSFKLMKQIVVPMKCKEFLEISLTEAKSMMDTCSVAMSDRTLGCADDCQNRCKENLSMYNSLKNSNDEYDIKKAAIYKKYAALYAAHEYDIRMYLIAKEQFDSTQSKLNALDVNLSEEIICYRVQIDCYSKNRAGNEVLGRFVFQFGKDGNPLSWSRSKMKRLCK